jgi:hypothetical protein
MSAVTISLPGQRRKVVIPGSLLAWLGFIAYLVAVKLALDLFLPDAFSDPGQAEAFGWAPIGIVAVLGGVGALLATRTGFPDALSPRVSIRQRIYLPALIGIGFAIVLITFDAVSGYSKLAAAHFGVEQQYSDPLSMLLIFTAAPAYVEAVYRLFPIPLMLLLISTLALRGRWQEPIFWVLAVATSLLEPLSQTTWALAVGAPIFAVAFAHGFALNLAQATLFRRYGFVASIVLRLGFYLVWHVVYVH